MCYNVLCDKYATRQVYGYCPTWALDWEYRKVRIMDQIRHTAADIITLQVTILFSCTNVISKISFSSFSLTETSPEKGTTSSEIFKFRSWT